MLKRILAGALTILFALCMVGCGGGDKPADKPAAEKKDVTADKAVLAYAELLMTGESANADAVGLSDAEKAELAGQFQKDLVELLGNAVPLSDKSAETIAKAYQEKCKKDMKFKAVVKKDDAENPVVELTTTPWDAKGFQNDPAQGDYDALVEMNMQLREGGSTPEQIKQNEEFQNLAVEAFTKSFNAFQMQDEKTLVVNCNKVNDHFAPADVKVLKDFLTGQQQ